MRGNRRGGWSYHGILNSLGQNCEWHVIGSNGIYYIHTDNSWRKVYYDTWALRTLDNWNELNFEKSNLILNRGENLIEVNSCFGGLAVRYKTDFLLNNFRYNYKDCDHVTLHKEMRKQGYKIFINPSQIVLYNSTNYCTVDSVPNNYDKT